MWLAALTLWDKFLQLVWSFPPSHKCSLWALANVDMQASQPHPKNKPKSNQVPGGHRGETEVLHSLFFNSKRHVSGFLTRWLVEWRMRKIFPTRVKTCWVETTGSRRLVFLTQRAWKTWMATTGEKERKKEKSPKLLTGELWCHKVNPAVIRSAWEVFRSCRHTTRSSWKPRRCQSVSQSVSGTKTWKKKVKMKVIFFFKIL